MAKQHDPPTFSEDDYLACLRVLNALADTPDITETEPTTYHIFQAAQTFYKAVKKYRKYQRNQAKTGETKSHPTPEASASVRFTRPAASDNANKSHAPHGHNMDEVERDALAPVPRRKCYICRRSVHSFHQVYSSMCPACGEENETKRHAQVDLTGRTAIVTGGRIKIGFAVAHKLLTCGARVIVTTRFPRDAATRFAACQDADQWLDRLSIYPLDLRSIAHIQAFADWVTQRHQHLDILVNNAAQTVRKPPAFYKHLLPLESQPTHTLPPHIQSLVVDLPQHTTNQLSASTDATSALTFSPLSDTPQLTSPAQLSQLPLLPDDTQHTTSQFPAEQFDEDGQQLDLRDQNSWTMRVQDVPLPELWEVQMINAIAPFALLQALEPLLQHDLHPHRFVVNVAAAEGQFGTSGRKSARHPHTNMSKASLNMLTRTTASEYARKGLFINSVDPGWVSLELPHPLRQAYANRGFQLPIDAIDGAARICDPIFEGIRTGHPVFGKLLKDYREVSW